MFQFRSVSTSLFDLPVFKGDTVTEILLYQCRLPPPQSPPKGAGDECGHDLAGHGNEREAGAYGKAKSESESARYSSEQWTGDKAGD